MMRLTHPELIKYIHDIDAAAYARQRNYVGGSTELSEHITRGAVSLPQVRDILLEHTNEAVAYKLINELAWREYWHMVWQVRGDDIFEYIRPALLEIRKGIPQAVLEAKTGILALDDGIRQLIQTGYIHNHMRMWIAGLVCNVARCDWKIGADWMHSYLIDGDFASNHLSWQWVAGCYIGKPYLPQQDNINTYTKTVQHGTYLDQAYSVIADMPVPAALAQVSDSLPAHDSKMPDSTITTDTLVHTSEILLYSPWTLDPEWRRDSKATRVLLIDSTTFNSKIVSQPVIDSIVWFAGQIPGLEIMYDSYHVFDSMPTKVIRKQYEGIAAWPGRIDPAAKLYPHIPVKFYPSFSSFWKQAQTNTAA